MSCQLCGKEVGKLRRLVDPEYCCAAHRAEAARQFSDEAEQETAVTETTVRLRHGIRAGVTMIGAFLLVTTIGMLSFSRVTATGRALSADVPDHSWFASSARGVAPITFHEKFESIGPNWLPGAVHSAAGVRHQLGAGKWTVSGGGVSPGILYVWKPTLDLLNYDFTFRATIERGGVGWAFRASDAGTLYAAKLILRSDGPDSSGCLQRFRRINGADSERTCEAQPVMLDRGTPYTIRATVSGSDFSVWLNGVLLATWSDPMLTEGGVGFFTEEGDSATLHSVSLSERDSPLGRLAAYFSLISR